MPGACARCVKPRTRTGAYCPEHTREYRREHYQKPEVAEARRSATLKHKYGITGAEFDALLEEQGGHCALCPATEDLCVDHNHTTKRVRGILCRNCNAALGQFRDDIERVRAAVKYLERG